MIPRCTPYSHIILEMSPSENHSIAIKISGRSFQLTPEQTTAIVSHSNFFLSATSSVWHRPNDGAIDLGDDVDADAFFYLLDELINSDQIKYLFHDVRDDVMFSKLFQLVNFLDIRSIDTEDAFAGFLESVDIYPNPVAVLRMCVYSDDGRFIELAKDMPTAIVRDPSFQDLPTSIRERYLADVDVRNSITDHDWAALHNGTSIAKKSHSSLNGEGIFFIASDWLSKKMMFLHYNVADDTWKELDPPPTGFSVRAMGMIMPIGSSTIYLMQQDHVMTANDTYPPLKFMAYDISEMKWRSLPRPVDTNVCILLFPGKSHLLAVENTESRQRSAWVFDVDREQWAKTTLQASTEREEWAIIHPFVELPQITKETLYRLQFDATYMRSASDKKIFITSKGNVFFDHTFRQKWIRVRNGETYDGRYPWINSLPQHCGRRYPKWRINDTRRITHNERPRFWRCITQDDGFHTHKRLTSPPVPLDSGWETLGITVTI